MEIQSDRLVTLRLLLPMLRVLRGEGEVQWTFPIAVAEKHPPAVAYCQKQKPADSNTADKNIENPTQQTTTGTSAARGSPVICHVFLL